MIERNKRKAIVTLHDEGMGLREIARRLHLSSNTVRAIIAQKGEMPMQPRNDKKEIDPELLERLFRDCHKRAQRVHEKLAEEEGISIGYSTLTWLIREHGLRNGNKGRCGRSGDVPGAEMQHDTSPYQVVFGDRKEKVIASLIYWRYSKIRFLKFYRSFNRFKMKCFLHEALMFWAYAAPVCIIDNTNLARLRGSGKHAVIAPEMETFAAQYGFEFKCHEIGHSNRKAGNERAFYTVETNFFPGRSFKDLEDMNQQALDWATVRMANRPTGKTKIIPAHMFEQEKPFLMEVSTLIHPPYEVCERRTDQYGYISFQSNYYWIPGTKRVDVDVLYYSNCIHIYHNRNKLTEYELPRDGIKNECFKPAGKAAPSYKPAYRKKPTAKEELLLRQAAPVFSDYLDFALKGVGNARHRMIRRLYGLYRKCSLPLMIQTLERALMYRITEMDTLERMVVLKLQAEGFDRLTPEVDLEFSHRETYQEGRFADEIDLSRYDQIMEESDGR